MFARHADRPAWRPSRVTRTSAHATSVAAHIVRIWLWNAGIQDRVRIRTYVRKSSVRRGAYSTNICSHRPLQPHQVRSHGQLNIRSRAECAPRSPWPARSCCSRTTTTSTGRSTRTSPARASTGGRGSCRPNTNENGPPAGDPYVKTGGVLLSQALASQVPSALRGLTALFGMGRGVSPSPKPPEKGERPRLPGPSKLHSATNEYHSPLRRSKKSVKPSTD
jgi:hypothetical protein